MATSSSCWSLHYCWFPLTIIKKKHLIGELATAKLFQRQYLCYNFNRWFSNWSPWEHTWRLEILTTEGFLIIIKLVPTDPCRDVSSHLASACPQKFISCRQTERLKGQGAVDKDISLCPDIFSSLSMVLSLFPKNTPLPAPPETSFSNFDTRKIY